jgi:hypothetical protein
MVPNLKRKGNSNMRKLKQYSIAGAAALAVTLGGTGLAVAASNPGVQQPSGDVHACVKPGGYIDYLQYRSDNYGRCNPGDSPWTWGRPGDGSGPAPTTFGVGQVKVNGNLWAQYETAELGAPGGDQASGTFVFTCNTTGGCNVTVTAYSTARGWNVYPRLLLQKYDNNTPSIEQYCEYADGSNNSGGTTALGTDPTNQTTVPLGVGGTFDCGSTTQTGSPGSSVTSINVPQGEHYEVFTTLTFNKATK